MWVAAIYRAADRPCRAQNLADGAREVTCPDRGRIVREIEIMSSIVMLPLCEMFLTFLRSRGGSLSALIIKDDADGTTETCACRFWMVSLTVILSPFQSPVALQISSPTFLGERPSGPILGANEEVAPTSPPTTRRKTSTIAVGSNFGGILSYPNLLYLLDNRNRTPM